MTFTSRKIYSVTEIVERAEFAKSTEQSQRSDNPTFRNNYFQGSSRRQMAIVHKFILYVDSKQVGLWKRIQFVKPLSPYNVTDEDHLY